MSFRQRRLKFEVTVDGNGWDNPVSLTGEKRFLQPQQFSLLFPNQKGKNTSRIALTDIVRVYAGFGAVNDDPLFTGFIIGKIGDISLSFTSLLGLVEGDRWRPDSFRNLSGLEAGYAIQKVAESVDMSGYSSALSFQVQGTNPVVVVPESFQSDSLTSKLTLIKSINELCVDSSTLPEQPLEYVFYEIDNVLHHRKTQPIDGTVEAPFSFVTIDDIAESPKVSLSSLVTKATVKGAAYKDDYGREVNHEATHEDESSSQLKRLFWRTYTDSSLVTYNQCFERAKREVEAGKFKTISTTIDNLELLNATPGYSIMEVENSNRDLDGFHRITDLAFSLGTGKNSVRARVNTRKPLIGGVV